MSCRWSAAASAQNSGSERASRLVQILDLFLRQELEIGPGKLAGRKIGHIVLSPCLVIHNKKLRQPAQRHPRRAGDEAQGEPEEEGGVHLK